MEGSPVPFLNGARDYLGRSMPQLEDDASATDLCKEMEEKNRSKYINHQWKKRRVRVRVVPAQPKPGAGEDEGHLEKTTHGLEGWRAVEEGQTGSRGHELT